MKNYIKLVAANEATFITHNGLFHGDDVMAAAIITMMYTKKEWVDQGYAPDSQKIRMARVPNIKSSDVEIGFCFDIGGGKFDHHQQGGNGFRENGVPYAAAGLVWRSFGLLTVTKWCELNNHPITSAEASIIMDKVDSDLIQGIDAHDCGVLPPLGYPTQGTSVSTAIKGFNPCWGEEQDFDGQFLKAVDFALDILINCMRNALASVKAEEIVVRKIVESDGEILVLEESLPWMAPILNPPEKVKEKAASLLYAIFPGIRGGWMFRAIPTEAKRGAAFRNPTPDSWCGLSGEELQKKCGVKDATFVHQSGHVGGAETKEGVISMVNEMIRLYREEVAEFQKKIEDKRDDYVEVDEFQEKLKELRSHLFR